MNPAEANAWIADRHICNACAVTERTSAADHDGENKPPPGTKYTARNRAKEV